MHCMPPKWHRATRGAANESLSCCVRPMRDRGAFQTQTIPLAELMRRWRERAWIAIWLFDRQNTFFVCVRLLISREFVCSSRRTSLKWEQPAIVFGTRFQPLEFSSLEITYTDTHVSCSFDTRPYRVARVRVRTARTHAKRNNENMTNIDLSKTKI